MKKESASKTVEKLAKELNVDKKTVKNHRKSLGIHGKNMTKEDVEKVTASVNVNKELKKRVEKNVEKVTKANKNFAPNVRRIDEKDVSSLVDMLQDAKERYVKNEELIQRLQFEIDNLDALMSGNTNGTVSSIPQLGTMEKYIKSNISLRNQILEFEKALGRTSYDEEDDPFA